MDLEIEHNQNMIAAINRQNTPYGSSFTTILDFSIIVAGYHWEVILAVGDALVAVAGRWSL